MKKKLTKITCFLFIITITLLLILINNNENTYARDLSQEGNFSSTISYTTFSPIYIDDDTDFITYGFLGSGTAGDPYLIQDYHIQNLFGDAIHIQATTKHFKILDCLIENSRTAIVLFNIAPGTAIVEGNTIRNNERTFYYYEADLTAITNNIFQNNEYSMSLEYCESLTITHNTFTDTGINIFYESDPLHNPSTYTFDNNSIGPKPIGWFAGQDNFAISSSDYGQIFLISCSNVTVENQIIYRPLRGICIYDCSEIKAQNNNCGIDIIGTSNSEISNNLGKNKFLSISYSDFIFVHHNTMNNGFYNYNSNFITLTNNTCQGGLSGIYFDGCSSCSIRNNTISFSLESGLYLVWSNNMIVANNSIYFCDIYGIKLIEVTSSIFYFNLVHGCTSYAVTMDDLCQNNVIHHNTFLGNAATEGSQGYDDGTSNTWYDVGSNEGNYWDDGDPAVPYDINGAASSQDLFPLANPLHTPVTINEYPMLINWILCFILLGLSSIAIYMKRK